MKWALRCAVSIAAIGLITQASADTAAQQSRALQQQGIAAYKAGNFAEAARDFAAALKVRPHSLRSLYNLAASSAKAGNADDAIRALAEYVDMGLTADIEHDNDFDALRNTPAFKAVLARMNANRALVGRSEILATLTGDPFLAEGIAFDPVTQSVFVSSVDQRKVVRITANGKTSDFIPAGRDGLLGAFGMAVDPGRRMLWISSSGVAQSKNLQPGQLGQGGIFAVSLPDGVFFGKVLATPKTKDKPYVIADLTVGPDGAAYATDSLAPRIYVREPPSIVVASESSIPSPAQFVWLESDAFESLQGITTTPDEKSFVVADYSMGLHFINRATKTVRTADFAAGTTLLGIDGLTRIGNTLIAVQNGITPQRIVAITLDASGSAVASVKVLSANDPNISEPSLGTVAGDKYCVVANAQWSRFKDDGTLQPGKTLDPPRIACLALPK